MLSNVVTGTSPCQLGKESLLSYSLAYVCLSIHMYVAPKSLDFCTLLLRLPVSLLSLHQTVSHVRLTPHDQLSEL